MGKYKGRYFFRQQVWRCGNYLEVEIYPVFQKAGKRRAKCRPTSAIQERLNQKRAEMHITRIAHLNFTEEDMALHLTYAENPDMDRAEKDIKNFMARLRRKYKKLGLELKYISTIEQGRKSGRVHVHMLINNEGLDRDEIEKLWGFGYANARRLQFGEEGITGLTRYITKDRGNGRRCTHSRNLIMPEPEIDDREIDSVTMGEMRDAFEEKRHYGYFEEKFTGFGVITGEYAKNAVNYGDYFYVFMSALPQAMKRQKE